MGKNLAETEFWFSVSMTRKWNLYIFLVFLGGAENTPKKKKNPFFFSSNFVVNVLCIYRYVYQTENQKCYPFLGRKYCYKKKREKKEKRKKKVRNSSLKKKDEFVSRSDFSSALSLIVTTKNITMPGNNMRTEY